MMKIIAKPANEACIRVGAQTAGRALDFLKLFVAKNGPVTLAEIKADASFADFQLVRMSRLSVMPVTPAQWEKISAMAK